MATVLANAIRDDLEKILLAKGFNFDKEMQILTNGILINGDTYIPYFRIDRYKFHTENFIDTFEQGVGAYALLDIYPQKGDAKPYRVKQLIGLRKEYEEAKNIVDECNRVANIINEDYGKARKILLTFIENNQEDYNRLIKRYDYFRKKLKTDQEKIDQKFQRDKFRELMQSEIESELFENNLGNWVVHDFEDIYLKFLKDAYIPKVLSENDKKSLTRQFNGSFSYYFMGGVRIFEFDTDYKNCRRIVKKLAPYFEEK